MEKFKDMVTDSLKKDLIIELQGWIGKDSVHNFDALADRLLEVQGMHCKCQNRKCVPHPYRCWPSMGGWITVGVLLFVCWCLIGNYHTERDSMWANWQAHWDQESAKKWREIDVRLAKHEGIVALADAYVLANSTTEKKQLVELRNDVNRLTAKIILDGSPR